MNLKPPPCIQAKPPGGRAFGTANTSRLSPWLSPEQWKCPCRAAILPGVKTVGKRSTTSDPAALDPLEAFRRADILQRQLERIHPFPKPRGFVFKARTWEEYALWRRQQTNPRLW